MFKILINLKFKLNKSLNIKIKRDYFIIKTKVNWSTLEEAGKLLNQNLLS